MSVKFSKPEAIEQKDIDLISQILGFATPDDVRNFFAEFNGSKPETNIFNVNNNNDFGINDLIHVSKIFVERKYLDHFGDKVFPVATAEGGNYVVIDLRQGQSVYFWDHEEPQNMAKLASGIYEFLDTLMPFDPDSVELKEGQVESAWIDPDFFNSWK